jgi:hypothetical protein
LLSCLFLGLLARRRLGVRRRTFILFFLFNFNMSALLFVDAFRFVQDFSGFLHLYWKYILHKPFELQFAHHILVVLGILAFDVGILHILIGSHPRKQPPLNPIHRIGPKLPPHYRNQCSYFPPTNPSCLCQAHPFW